MQIEREPTASPFSTGSVAARIKALASPAQAITDRVGFICGRVNGRRVLDVGIVEHDYAASLEGHWLHHHVANAAKSCLGIDILEDDIIQLQARGCDVKLHDLCLSPLD